LQASATQIGGRGVDGVAAEDDEHVTLPACISVTSSRSDCLIDRIRLDRSV